MKSITLRSHVGRDGILKLQVPEDLKDLDVTVTIQSVTPSPKTSENLGWQPGFFEEVVGGWEGEPLVRSEQPELETRDELL
jgi:hypothetical protein